MTATKTTWLTPYLTVWADGAGTVVQALPAARAATGEVLRIARIRALTAARGGG